MNERNEQSVMVEVESRLEDLFGNMDEPVAFLEEGGEIEASPFRDLKALVLSIDWEITDETMTDFIREVDSLKNTCRDDKILVLFLQLLGSLGKYIKNNRAAAHPDSIKVLNSVYNSMEGIVFSKGMGESEKKKLLSAEVDQYKRLKEEISVTRIAAVPPASGFEKPRHEEQTKTQAPAVSKMPPHEAFAYALEEIKQTIHAEFQALRAELKLWRQA